METKVKALGFTGKFYAIWTITTTTEEVCPGCIKTFTLYQYGRKASNYLNVAQAKYPDAVLNDKLNDRTRNFWEKDYTWTSVDVFRFGKYKGQYINDCPDTDYIAWYWKNIYDEHKEFVENILISRGYQTRINEIEDEIFLVKEKTMVSKDQVALENNDENNMSDQLRNFYNAKEITINPTHNLTMNGNYREENVIYRFLDFKYYPATYYSPEYYLPLINGKAKRIKNKTVVIDKFNVKMDNNKIIIEVLNFKVTK